MAKTNTSVIATPVFTHEGAKAQSVGPYAELCRTLMTCLLWEDTFYESGDSVAARIAELVPKVEPEKIAALAVEARSKMQLRHAPLFLVRELARRKGTGPLVRDTLETVIQRADELSEFVSLYWKDKRQPLSAGVKKGLASAFQKFNAYRLAKYNRDSKVKLRDVLFLCHAKPKDAEQAALWKSLINGTLQPPDTWEVALSASKDKKETWERLLREGKLGGLAVLRNLRNMQQANVDGSLIKDRLSKGIARALPFRFVAAARHAVSLEPEIEQAMFLSAKELPMFPGRTALLVDVSYSMDAALSSKSDMNRIDAAAALAILLREKAETALVGTFSNHFVEVPARRGFALRDAIAQSQPHSGTATGAAIQVACAKWKFDRLIVITDEQSQDAIPAMVNTAAYMVNVAPYKHGISYGNGWQHIDGWSERILDYIRAVEEKDLTSAAEVEED